MNLQLASINPVNGIAVVAIRSIKMCLTRSNMRTWTQWIQPPGVTQRILSGRALPGGPSELTPTVTEVIFVRAWFLPVWYKCTETVRTE